jgi:ParB family chromosome partitioning protein
MLSLAEDLKLAIRAGLKGVHAMALQKLSAKNLGLTEQKAQLIREKTIQKVVAEKLSVIATRKLVAEVITSHSQSEVANTTRKKAVLQVSRRLEQLSLETLKQANPTELIDLQEVLRKKLVEIEQVLKQN